MQGVIRATAVIRWISALTAPPPSTKSADNLSLHISGVSHGLFSSGSGLNAAATNLDVIGNNIANSPHTALNQARPLLPICLPVRSGTGGKSCRYHSGLYRWHDHNTGRGLDVAISQNGFFRLVEATVRCSTAVTDNLSWMKIVTGEYARFTADGLPGNRYAADIQQGANPTNISIPNTLMAAKLPPRRRCRST